MTLLLAELPTEVKYLECPYENGQRISAVLILPIHERVEDLNSYVINPGDGKSYRIYKAEELRRLRVWESKLQDKTHAQYRVLAVQVFP